MKTEIPASIRHTIQSFTWERWLERPYGTFVLSLFAGANSWKAMERFGVKAEYRSCLFQDGWWYESPEVTAPYAEQLKKYRKNGGSISRLTRACEREYAKGLRAVTKAVRSRLSIQKKLTVLRDAEASVVPFIWLAHGFDDVYTEWLERDVPKYIDGDVAKYIGDVTLPKKKTAATKMEDAIRRGTEPKKIVEQFGWIKARTGFSDPFTVAEIKADQKRIIRTTKPSHPRRVIPIGLRQLVEDARAVVYLRTLRTDVIFHLLYLARPMLHEAAKYYGIPFSELAQFSIHDLIAGNPVQYPVTVFATDKNDFAFFKRPIVTVKANVSQTIKGTVAYQGVIRGRVKIMKVAADGHSLKAGDILVAPMTFPSFIMAMQRAAAFVTDEGGLTCHAAIVAREMHKPCIVGTKHATRVLKDGDRVEVDAVNGIVRRLGK